MELCELYIEPFNADKKSAHWIRFCRIWTKNANSYMNTAWKVSKYGVISGPHFPLLGLNMEIYAVEQYMSSFLGIRNVIASDVVRSVSYLHSRDIEHRNIKPAKVLVSKSHYKSCKHKKLDMTFGKKPIVCKFGDLWEERSVYAKNNALTVKNHTTTCWWWAQNWYYTKNEVFH